MWAHDGYEMCLRQSEKLGNLREQLLHPAYSGDAEQKAAVDIEARVLDEMIARLYMSRRDEESDLYVRVKDWGEELQELYGGECSEDLPLAQVEKSISTMRNEAEKLRDSEIPIDGVSDLLSQIEHLHRDINGVYMDVVGIFEVDGHDLSDGQLSIEKDLSNIQQALVTIASKNKDKGYWMGDTTEHLQEARKELEINIPEVVTSLRHFSACLNSLQNNPQRLLPQGYRLAN